MKKSLIFLAAAILLLSGCKTWDGSADYGNVLIYIPQAMFDGGITNDYPVPSGGGEDSRNFRCDDRGIHILLGVMRSGSYSGEAFSVKVSASDSDFTEFTLPEKVSVEAGKKSASFTLDLPLSVLEDYAGQTPAITVSISDPTAYSLSDVATSVRVVTDIDALAALIL